MKFISRGLEQSISTGDPNMHYANTKDWIKVAYCTNKHEI